MYAQEINDHITEIARIVFQHGDVVNHTLYFKDFQMKVDGVLYVLMIEQDSATLAVGEIDSELDSEKVALIPVSMKALFHSIHQEPKVDAHE